MSASAKSKAKFWDIIATWGSDPISRTGWRNSYSGELFSEDEMREYAEDVQFKLQSYLDKMNTVILEIGCASGITMYQLLPNVKRYIGTDMAGVNLDVCREYNKDKGITNVELIQCRADEIDNIGVSDVNMVVINSVIQYFDDKEYLENVIRKAIMLMNGRGIIYIGDVRDEDKKSEYIRSVEDYYDDNGMDKDNLPSFSDELFVSKRYWGGLQGRIEGITDIEVTDKIGEIKNELTNFRYDVLLKIGELK